MATTATPAAFDGTQASELLEVARSILRRHHDQDIAQKTFALHGYIEMSKTYPDRDYREHLGKAFADLTTAVQRHLNAELDAVAKLFGLA